MNTVATRFIAPQSASEANVPISYSVVQVPIDRIRPFEFQPRKWFDPKEIYARAESLRSTGQQCAVSVERVYGDPKYDYELVDGESRWRSARKARITTLWAMVRSRPFTSRAEKHLASLVANFNRSDHTPMEVSDALHVQVTEGGKSQEQLARSIGRSSAWVLDYLSLQKLHPDIKPLLHPAAPKTKRLSPAVGFELSRVPVEQQLEVLRASRGYDGRATKFRVILEIDRALGTGQKVNRHTSPAKRRARLLNTVQSVKQDLAKLQALLNQDKDEETHKVVKEELADLQLSTSRVWTLEREQRRQKQFDADPAHVIQLRAGIAEFRNLLEGRRTLK